MNHERGRVALARCGIALMVALASACGSSGSGSAPPPSAGTPPPAPDAPQPPPSDPAPPQPPLPDPGDPDTPPSPAPPLSGLDTRPPNDSCLAWEKPVGSQEVRVERFTNLTFPEPVNMVQAPHDDETWYVVLLEGVVRKFVGSSPSTSSVFVDLRNVVTQGFEAGLLGMAFHPRYPEDPRVFFKYNAGGNPWLLRISSIETTDGGQTLDPATERVVLTIEKPTSNHNGGHLAFGPDGYLYIGVGDGGGAGDEHGPTGNGQRLTTLLGKILRLDVDSAQPYAIPPTNPFAGNEHCPPAGRDEGACPETYAYGFRNPWRWSFDREDGTLWLGDVGQARWEEVNIVRPGLNYGWRCREGTHPYAPDTPGCSTATFEEPIVEYSHAVGRSVTGGYVYRGHQPTALRGRYLFGDFVYGELFAWMDTEAPAPREPTPLLTTDLNIVSFAEGNDGELYIVHYGDEGSLHRIVFGSEQDSGTIPTRLSETGCVDPQLPTQTAAGLIPYAVNAPFWSDGATKERWLALPNGSRITIEPDGHWQLPIGSVIVKSFRLGERLIETRLLMRHPDGSWGGYTYEWDAAQSDATLIRSGARRAVGEGQTWIFPSEADCLTCHTAAASRTLGLETVQLNRELTYPQTGRTANQLVTLDHIGIFDTPPGNVATLAAMPDPFDDDAPLEARARAYLHTNCAQCHRPGGPTPSNMDLRYSTTLADTNTCDVPPSAGTLGIENARLLAPGNPAASLILQRMSRRDQHAMPPLGSNQSDALGVALITRWIEGVDCRL